ncbi:MAG: MAPEG family protein [Rhodospirillaceae bacterium]
MPMFVTPLYAALLALWFLLLSAVVIRHRGKSASPGDGGNSPLQRAIRGHANFAEYVPLALLMMAILELTRTSVYVLHALGIALLIGRILHGYTFAFSRRWQFGRTWGTVLTFVVLLAEALLCLVVSMRGHDLWLRGLL